MAMQVTVTTALKLTADLKKSVINAIESKLGKTAYELNEVVDPSVIGGIRITFGSKQYDASVQSKLEALQSLV